MNFINNRRALITLALLAAVIFFTYTLLRIRRSNIEAEELFCHLAASPYSLPDISDNPPSSHKRNIFFMETSCNSYRKGKISVLARQACAVESAARLNPNMDVYMLFASPGLIKDENTESDKILKVLSSYSNIKLMHMNIGRYIEQSPVEKLWKTGQVKNSLYPLAHTSDILRLLTLWKFGGIYMDLDVIVVKTFESIPENFAGAQSIDLVANGVIGFSRYGKGRTYIEECMEDISHNFDGSKWGANGPQLVTRNIFSHCPKFDAETIVRFGRCEEFRVFPPSAFYLIPYQKWDWYFNNNLTDSLERYIEERSYLIHVWNKFSYERTIKKNDTNSPYLRIASKYCPGVVHQLDEYF